MQARLRRGDRNITVPWNTQREQNRGLCSFSSFWAAFELSANKDVWACWLLIGEYLENKELILTKAHSECSLKLLKFEMPSFICFPHSSVNVFLIFNPEGWIPSLADWVTQGRFGVLFIWHWDGQSLLLATVGLWTMLYEGHWCFDNCF